MELKKPFLPNQQYKFQLDTPDIENLSASIISNSFYHPTKSKLDDSSDIKNLPVSGAFNVVDAKHGIYKLKKAGIRMLNRIPLQRKRQKVYFVPYLFAFIFFLATFIYNVITCLEYPWIWGLPAGAIVEQCIFLCRMGDVYVTSTEALLEPGYRFRLVTWFSTSAIFFTNVWMEAYRLKSYMVTFAYVLAVCHSASSFYMLALPIEHDWIGRANGDTGHVMVKIGRWKIKVLFW